MNTIEMSLDFGSSEEDKEDLETLTQVLHQQLSELDEVENVSRLYHFREAFDSNIKSDNVGKPISGSLSVAFDKLKSSKILRTILARLLGKQVKFEIERDGKKAKLELHCLSEQEMEKVLTLLKDY
jgi:hypothetical protein